MEKQLLLIGLMLCTGAGLARAEEASTNTSTSASANTAASNSSETTEAEQSMDAQAAMPGGEAKVTQRLAEEFNVQPAKIEALRNKKMGYGEIHHALSLAKQLPGGLTQDNINTVMQMRQEEHMGWGQIAHSMNTNLGAVIRSGKEGSSTDTEAQSLTRSGIQAHTGLGNASAKSNVGASAGFEHSAAGGSSGLHSGVGASAGVRSNEAVHLGNDAGGRGLGGIIGRNSGGSSSHGRGQR